MLFLGYLPRAKMEVNIQNPKLRSVWDRIWARLPQDVQTDLLTWVQEAKDDIQSCPEVEFGCGKYSETIRIIILYNGDLNRLSDAAIGWVIAHELGHAYCHLKCGTAGPGSPKVDFDYGADCVASSWGFQPERDQFEQERKVVTGG